MAYKRYPHQLPAAIDRFLWYLFSIRWIARDRGQRRWDIVVLEASCEGQGRSWKWADRGKQCTRFTSWFDYRDAGDAGTPAIMLKLALSSVGPREHRSESKFLQRMSLTNMFFCCFDCELEISLCFEYLRISRSNLIAIDNLLHNVEGAKNGIWTTFEG
jgi:hypothetical protein